MILTKYDEIMEKVNLTPEARERILDNVCEAVTQDKAASSGKTAGRNWKKYLSLAACCILVVAGAAAASGNGLFDRFMGGSSADGSFEMEYDSSDGIEESQEEGGAPVEGAPAVSSQSESTKSIGSENSSGAAAEEKQTDDMSIGEDEAISFVSKEEMSDYLGFDVDCPEIRNISEKAGKTTVRYILHGEDVGEITFDDGETMNYFMKAEGREELSVDDKIYDTEAVFCGEETSGTLRGKGDTFVSASWTSADGFTYAAYIEEGLTLDEWTQLISKTK